jgi:hypothetical protein
MFRKEAPMAPNVVIYDNTISYEDDLEFVRRQLDDLALIRAMGQFRPVDDVRYRTLCSKEQFLLGQRRRAALAG